MRKEWWLLGIFALLVAVLGIGLTLNPREVPSPLIGKAAPAFELPLLHDPGAHFSQKQMLGRVWILNVWASWCVPCLDEHPIITDLAKSGTAPIIGLNYKDGREQALAWLRRHGDPFHLTVQDAAGRVAIDYGVYGVPETYAIDKRGIIRYKHIGPLTPKVAKDTLRPLIAKLHAE
jgi:cytochrome c biogenesis protein CcmG/thiol:disulfide interchange protein DsbE